MSETKNAYENPEKKHHLQDLKSFEENRESFTIGAEEAAQILGVNRSRLSQLTGKGAFPYERRKIETRNRLFYKLSDLLNHQRSQIQGNQYLNHSHFVEQTYKHEYQEKDGQANFPSLEEKESTNFKEILNKNSYLKKLQFQNKNLLPAKDIYFSEITNHKNIKVTENLLFIKEKLIQQEEAIGKIKHDFIKKENIILKTFKETNESISNTKYNIYLLNHEIKKISEICHSLTLQNKLKSNDKIQKKCSWKKKKAKYAPKLTTGR